MTDRDPLERIADALEIIAAVMVQTKTDGEVLYDTQATMADMFRVLVAVQQNNVNTTNINIGEQIAQAMKGITVEAVSTSNGHADTHLHDDIRAWIDAHPEHLFTGYRELSELMLVDGIEAGKSTIGKVVKPLRQAQK